MIEIDLTKEISRRQVLQRLGLGGAMLSLPGLLAACGGDSSSSSTSGGFSKGSSAEIDSVTWTLSSAPPTLDLSTGFTLSALLAIITSLEGTMTVDDQLRLKPLLATAFRQPDPTTYVYTVRRGVRYWDGSVMTPEDVAYSFARHADPDAGSQLGGYFGDFESVKVTGEDEVTITMKQPDPIFPFAVPTLAFVLPQKFVERQGRQLGVAGGSTVNTMGTGPYIITSFDDTELTLERNDDYWGDKPPVRAAKLKFISNPQTSLLAIRSGESDGMFDLPDVGGKSWDRLPSARAVYAPGMWVDMLAFNVEAEPWNDVHVRRAVAHALDRDGYVKAFLGGHARAAAAIVAPEQWAAVATSDEVEALYARIPQYEYDLEAAKRELSQSRYPDGFTASVQYPNDEPAVGRALVSLSEALKQIGVTLNVREVTHDKWNADWHAHKDLGLTYMSFGPDAADPVNYVALVYPSKNATENSFNVANFRSTEVDDLLDKQANSTDKRERADAIGQILEISGEDLPYLPLWWKDTGMAINDRLTYPGFNTLYYLQNWLALLRSTA